jgi:hypothetical protein
MPDQLPHDSRAADYGAKARAKARLGVDFSVKTVKLRVIGAGRLGFCGFAMRGARA